jgi:glycosyltransferase involved in cell wall biosynthesis/SAM-dependent methyltransferase
MDKSVMSCFEPRSGQIQTGLLGERGTVTVVITTFGQARFLADSISSAIVQTHEADDIIVVDDGSTDDLATVVANFDKVRLIRQEKRGLSAARNTGLQKCVTSHILFLDADDRLLPNALEAGLDSAARCIDCAFVYGRYRIVSEKGQLRGVQHYDPTTEDAYLLLLRRNVIGMHATVLYRRDRLLEVGGFDESLHRHEDYDLYLRIARKYPIANHPSVVAEYREHGDNMSPEHTETLQAALAVLARHEIEARSAGNAGVLAAVRQGRASWRKFYALQELRSLRGVRGRELPSAAIRSLLRAIRWSPTASARLLAHFLGHRMMRVLPPFVMRQGVRFMPAWVVREIERVYGSAVTIPLGSVGFGDLRRLSPVSRAFGFDRGTPVDRYYIERFLAKNAGHISGRVLEIGDNTYTRRFGGSRVDHSDILHIDYSNPCATFIGDLAHRNVLPEAIFDCIVLTQTLHLIFDVRAAIETLHRALKPGGVLLITSPGISPVDRGEWEATWYWSLTAAALRGLLQERFHSRDVTVEAHGNVFAATCFLYGIAVEELDKADLDVDDASFPVIVAGSATK